jgi:hypothetical protein
MTGRDRKKETLGMRKILESLTVMASLFIFLFLIPNALLGEYIQLTEEIKIDTAANFQEIPSSFCTTEDNLFLITDHKAGIVKIFKKEENLLKFINVLGPRFENKKFVYPIYCFYNRKKGMLGVFDYGVREIFIFNREKSGEFTWIKNVPCQWGGYDIQFAGDAEQLVVSGFLNDNENKPFDLYSINIKTGKINYLLPSHQKYNLRNFEDYILEYRQKRTLPAVGIYAFIDIQGNELFFVWEGALRIIRLNLLSRKQMVFGHETPDYAKPDGYSLATFYKNADQKNLRKKKETMAFIRNIFATPGHVFLVYETAKSKNSNNLIFRLQTYTPDGFFLEDVLIPGNPCRQMWFDKENHELYALSEKKGSNNNEFSIIKYKINRIKYEELYHRTVERLHIALKELYLKASKIWRAIKICE